MAEHEPIDRRTVLKSLAAGVAAGPLAGCTSASSGPEAETDDGGSSSDAGGSGSGSASFGGWMDDVGNYDGVVDETGKSEVTVKVGANGNGGAYGFGPAAVRVDAGTTVVWKWTGAGGSHNVAAEDGSFESDLSTEKGYAFERAFDEAGTVKYACVPHRAMGMKGVVVVD